MALFEARPASKVIPFDSFTNPPLRGRAVLDSAAKPAKTPRRPGRPVPEEQGSLEFLAPVPGKPRTLSTTVEAMIYCEEPVASILHRLLSAVLDCSMIILGYGLFLTAFHLLGGEFLLTRVNRMIFVAAIPILAALYGFLWAMWGMETPGMRWMGLRLTTFDGFEPERRQRLLRFGGSCLSLCTVLGLLWAFADEEHLVWQDHISRTFPTPLNADKQVFHRK